MECEFVRNNLFRIAEGSLSAPENTEIQDHLHLCPECSRIVAGFRKTMDLLESDIRRETNPFATTRILQYIESAVYPEKDAGKRSFSRILQPALVTLSLALALLAGFSIGKKGSGGLQIASPERELESIRTDLYISDFTDEDKTFILNP